MFVNEREKQIDIIYKLITEISSGNLEYRAPVNKGDDDLNAVIIGINMLAEELEATTVSKEFLDRIYKGVMDMLFVLDHKNNILQVNTAVNQMLGYSDAELLGKPFSIVFVRNEPKAMEKMYKELDKKGYLNNIERSFKTKKGKTLHVSFSSALLTDSGQHSGDKLFIAKDISKIKRTEQQLRERNEEMNTFIYRASHDLKGPVASIMGLIELAKEEMEEDPSLAHSYMSMIGESAQRLNSVLMEFLQLGHITQASMKYSFINFQQLLSEVMDNLQFIPGYQQTEFQLNISDAPYRSKKPLIKAILQNLIENAVKYRKLNHATQINISIGLVEQEIAIQVTDNGIGMSKRVQDNIFKMFYRGTERSEGTGLGLYIVQKSVEALKAKISVKSKEEHGTTVSVRIPNKIPRRYPSTVG